MNTFWLAALEGALMVCLVATAGVVWRVDMRRLIIPDSCGLILLASGLLHAWVRLGAPAAGGFWASLPEQAMVGACVFGYGFLALRFVFSNLFGQEALGLGDVKLAFGVGAWIGAPYFLLYLLATSAVALVTYATITLGRMRRPMHGRPDAPAGSGWIARLRAWGAKRVRPPRAFPYGPAMAAGLVVVVAAEKAGLLGGYLGLAPVWALLS